MVEDGSVRPVDEESDPTDRILYRVELDLEPVSAGTVLDRVSADVTDVAPPVQEAARTASVRRYEPIDSAQRPVKLDDGTFYRVYLAAEYGPPESHQLLVAPLRFLAPLAGLFLGYWVWVTHRRNGTE